MLDLPRLRPDFDDLLTGFVGTELEARISNLPLGVPIVAVHGDRDEAVNPAQSRRFVAEAVARGDRARLVEIGGADHDDLVDPGTPAWETVERACLR